MACRNFTAASLFVRAVDSAVLSTIGAFASVRSDHDDFPSSSGLVVFASSTAFFVPLRKASMHVRRKSVLRHCGHGFLFPGRMPWLAGLCELCMQCVCGRQTHLLRYVCGRVFLFVLLLCRSQFDVQFTTKTAERSVALSVFQCLHPPNQEDFEFVRDSRKCVVFATLLSILSCVQRGRRFAKALRA
jgi:hypothetical protein